MIPTADMIGPFGGGKPEHVKAVGASAHDPVWEGLSRLHDGVSLRIDKTLETLPKHRKICLKMVLSYGGIFSRRYLPFISNLENEYVAHVKRARQWHRDIFGFIHSSCQRIYLFGPAPRLPDSLSLPIPPILSDD